MCLNETLIGFEYKLANIAQPWAAGQVHIGSHNVLHGENFSRSLKSAKAKLRAKRLCRFSTLSLVLLSARRLSPDWVLLLGPTCLLRYSSFSSFSRFALLRRVATLIRPLHHCFPFPRSRRHKGAKYS